MSQTAANIHTDTGNVERYTPWHVVETARIVMGSIDTDPASSWRANITVKARTYYTETTNGLAWPWFGNVWMNHPFGKKSNPRWIQYAVDQYLLGNAKQVTCICYASTSEPWFAPLFSFAQCWLGPGRLNYVDGVTGGRIRNKEGRLTGNSKGSVVTYMGPHVGRFAMLFAPLGRVTVPYDWSVERENHDATRDCPSS